jgi:type IV secretory pathway protease TraF
VDSDRAMEGKVRWRQGLRWVGLGASLALLFGSPFLRFVLTPSLPRGLYLALPPRPPYQVGDLVAFCPPAAIGKTLLARHLVAPGRCPGGSVALAKRVAALAALVCAGPEGVAVDGYLLPWPSFPVSLGLPRYRGCGPTPAGCAFVLGDSPDSIDSRTFGCVPVGSLSGRLLPLVTEGSSR